VTKPSEEILLNEEAKPLDTRSIACHVREIIRLSGEDPNREGLRKTPERFEKAFKFLTSGYHQNVEHLLNGATFSVSYDEMVVVKDIEFFSLCEHHLLPFRKGARRLFADQQSTGAQQNRATGEYVRATPANSGAHDQPDCQSH
jgi:GTP cyclohydrolase I